MNYKIDEAKLDKTTNNYIVDIKQIVSEGKNQVYSVVNSTIVKVYWLIGKRIVEEEQNGKERADYGKEVVKTVSFELTKEFGRGFSVTNIKYFRQFYQLFPFDSISHLASDQLESIKKSMIFQLFCASKHWSYLPQ